MNQSAETKNELSIEQIIKNLNYSTYAKDDEIILKFELLLSHRKIAYLEDSVLILKERFSSAVLQKFIQHDKMNAEQIMNFIVDISFNTAQLISAIYYIVPESNKIWLQFIKFLEKEYESLIAQEKIDILDLLLRAKNEIDDLDLNLNNYQHSENVEKSDIDNKNVEDKSSSVNSPAESITEEGKKNLDMQNDKDHANNTDDLSENPDISSDITQDSKKKDELSNINNQEVIVDNEKKPEDENAVSLELTDENVAIKHNLESENNNAVHTILDSELTKNTKNKTQHVVENAEHTSSSLDMQNDITSQASHSEVLNENTSAENTAEKEDEDTLEDDNLDVEVNESDRENIANINADIETNEMAEGELEDADEILDEEDVDSANEIEDEEDVDFKNNFPPNVVHNVQKNADNKVNNIDNVNMEEADEERLNNQQLIDSASNIDHIENIAIDNTKSEESYSEVLNENMSAENTAEKEDEDTLEDDNLDVEVNESDRENIANINADIDLENEIEDEEDVDFKNNFPPNVVHNVQKNADNKANNIDNNAKNTEKKSLIFGNISEKSSEDFSFDDDIEDVSEKSPVSTNEENIIEDAQVTNVDILNNHQEEKMENSLDLKKQPNNEYEAQLESQNLNKRIVNKHESEVHNINIKQSDGTEEELANDVENLKSTEILPKEKSHSLNNGNNISPENQLEADRQVIKKNINTGDRHEDDVDKSNIAASEISVNIEKKKKSDMSINAQERSSSATSNPSSQNINEKNHINNKSKSSSVDNSEEEDDYLDD